ncbi:MAG: Uma2 family endonuclease [Chloroflexi bacterium]|nr:Uma2 family endonuclease [Chloroflexota bacterium]
MVSKPRLVTAEELLDMPGDGYRYELVRGELQKMAPAGARHGRSAGKVSRSLMNHVATNNLGEVYIAEAGFLLASDPDHVRVPDAAFVRRERFEEVGDVDGFFPGPPDLAVEVISPSDRYTEVAEKVEDWLNAGTRMVIVVDPRRRVAAVHSPGREPITLTDQDTLEGGDVVPGWSMPVVEIFA